MSFKKSIFSLVLVLMPFWASAQSSTALPFIRTAHIADDSSTWASFENPNSALWQQDKFSVGAELNLWAPSRVTYLSAAGTILLNDKLAASASFSYGLGEAYPVYSSSGQKSGTFSPNSMILNLGFAYRILPQFSLGVNLHKASETIAEKATYGAYYCDLMISGEFSALKASAGIVALGTKVQNSAGISCSLPTSARLSLAYSGGISETLSYSAFMDADYYLAGAVGVNLRGKLAYNEMLGLCAGAHLSTKACVLPSYASLGLEAELIGIKARVSTLLGGELSGTLLLNLAYSF